MNWKDSFELMIFFLSDNIKILKECQKTSNNQNDELFKEC